MYDNPSCLLIRVSPVIITRDFTNQPENLQIPYSDVIVGHQIHISLHLIRFLTSKSTNIRSLCTFTLKIHGKSKKFLILKITENKHERAKKYAEGKKLSIIYIQIMKRPCQIVLKSSL